jgi:hypothetical protein
MIQGIMKRILQIGLIRSSGVEIVSSRPFFGSVLMIVNFRLDMSRLHAQWLVEQKSTSF